MHLNGILLVLNLGVKGQIDLKRSIHFTGVAVKFLLTAGVAVAFEKEKVYESAPENELMH